MQGSIQSEGGIFRNELACHENDNKTNEFFYKYTWSWILDKDSEHHLIISRLKRTRRNTSVLRSTETKIITMHK